MKLSKAWDVTPEGKAAIDARLTMPCGCGGESASLKRRVIASGATTVVLQCDTCGRACGGAMKVMHHFQSGEYPEFEEGKADAFWEDYHRRARVAAADRRDAWIAERAGSKEAFYASGRWQWMRDAVMKRAGRVCEACGAKPAETVHHLTYSFGLDAPLYTLRALCHHCHTRMHTRGDAWHDLALPAHHEAGE